MPETGIGLFPDVGGGWYLSRLPGRIGQFLATTGARLDGAECVWAGISTHYLPAAVLASYQRACKDAKSLTYRRLDGADHGLQRAAAGVDGVQQVWAWTEQWARQPAAGLCAPLRLLHEQQQVPSAAGTS